MTRRRPIRWAYPMKSDGPYPMGYPMESDGPSAALHPCRSRATIRWNPMAIFIGYPMTYPMGGPIGPHPSDIGYDREGIRTRDGPERRTRYRPTPLLTNRNPT